MNGRRRVWTYQQVVLPNPDPETKTEKRGKEALELINKFDTKNIECVYNGKTGCMCGCNGNYVYHSNHKGGSETNEVNDRKVVRRFNLMVNKLNRDVSLIDNDEVFYHSAGYFGIDNGTRTTVVYFVK